MGDGSMYAIYIDRRMGREYRYFSTTQPPIPSPLFSSPSPTQIKRRQIQGKGPRNRVTLARLWTYEEKEGTNAEINGGKREGGKKGVTERAKGLNRWGKERGKEKNAGLERGKERRDGTNERRRRPTIERKTDRIGGLKEEGTTG